MNSKGLYPLTVNIELKPQVVIYFATTTWIVLFAKLYEGPPKGHYAVTDMVDFVCLGELMRVNDMPGVVQVHSLRPRLKSWSGSIYSKLAWSIRIPLLTIRTGVDYLS